MKEHRLQDFILYYQDAFILNPDNVDEVGEIYYDRHVTGGLKFKTGDLDESLDMEANMRKLPTLDHTRLEWEHVKRPRLGYRHMEGGKYLFRAIVNRADQRAKGLHPRCVSLETPTEFASAVNALKKAYVTRRHLNLEAAREIYFPSFVSSLKEAVYRLQNEPEAMGFAISYDLAITLGRNADEVFVLLFNGDKIGSSVDGKTWNLDNPEYDDVIKRHAK